jgi:preprotein translocase subunit SecB
MTEGNGNGQAGERSDGQGAAPPPEAQPVKVQILAQFIRDLSFENALAQKGVQGEVVPEIQVIVNLDAKKRSAEHQYEVLLKFKVTSKNRTGGETLFLLELEYGGVFHIENVPEAQLHPFLLIECPRLLFPFVRRIVSDLTRDGGFPPVNLDVVDFVALYRNELARRAAAAQPKADVTQ